jgi:hypothetical protein
MNLMSGTGSISELYVSKDEKPKSDTHAERDALANYFTGLSGDRNTVYTSAKRFWLAAAYSNCSWVSTSAGLKWRCYPQWLDVLATNTTPSLKSAFTDLSADSILYQSWSTPLNDKISDFADETDKGTLFPFYCIRQLHDLLVQHSLLLHGHAIQSLRIVPRPQHHQPQRPWSLSLSYPRHLIILDK